MPRRMTSALPSGVRDLIASARENEKRKQLPRERYAFFQRVSIRTAGGRCYSAFSREISEFGIGLLHDVALTPGEIECRITAADGRPIPVQLEIIWCEPCGDGWYISGGEFIGME